jgi:hypothetical protein
MLWEKYRNSMRRALQAVERGDMSSPPKYSPALKKLIRLRKGA